jgi:hypothetical protein
MTNDLTTTNGGAVATQADYDPFAAAAAEMGVFAGSYLKFSGNDGDYTYGPEASSKTLEHGTQLAVDMSTFNRGWICWKEGEAIEEVMVPILEGAPPPQATLTDHGPYATYQDGTKDGWTEQRSVSLHLLDTGELFVWKATSKSALRAFANLVNDYAKVYRTKPGKVPVIEIGATSFEPKVGDKGGPQKKIGKKYAPVINIVGWLANEEFLALADAGTRAAAEAAEASRDAGEENDAAHYEQAQETVQEPKTTTAAPVEGGRRAKRF